MSHCDPGRATCNRDFATSIGSTYKRCRHSARSDSCMQIDWRSERATMSPAAWRMHALTNAHMAMPAMPPHVMAPAESCRTAPRLRDTGCSDGGGRPGSCRRNACRAQHVSLVAVSPCFVHAGGCRHVFSACASQPNPTCLINDEECAVANGFPGERAAEAPERAPSALRLNEVPDAFHRPRKPAERGMETHLHAALHVQCWQLNHASAPS